MEFIFEVLFELIGELLLQTIVEILFEAGFHSVLEIRKKRKERNPVVATTGYILIGTIIGAITLFIFPKSLISPQYRTINLILTPIVAGIIMAVMGRWREKKGQDLIRIDKFIYGFIFAFSFALIRFHWAS